MLVFELVIGCIGVDHNPLHAVTAELLLSLKHPEMKSAELVPNHKGRVRLHTQQRAMAYWASEPKVSKPKVDLKYVDRLVRSEMKFYTWSFPWNIISIDNQLCGLVNKCSIACQGQIPSEIKSHESWKSARARQPLLGAVLGRTRLFQHNLEYQQARDKCAKLCRFYVVFTKAWL